MEKITQRNAIEFVLNTYDIPTEYVEKFNQMLEALDKRKSAPRAPSAEVLANQKLRETILEHTEVGACYTIADLRRTIPELKDATSHKISALITPLKKEGKFERLDKRVATYRRC